MYPEKKIKTTKKSFGSPELAELYTGEYVLRQWDTEKKNLATSKATKIDLISMIPIVDVGLMNTETLAMCLVGAPFPTNPPKDINYDMIKKMPGWLSNKLSAAIREINQEVTKERQKNS